MLEVFDFLFEYFVEDMVNVVIVVVVGKDDDVIF